MPDSLCTTAGAASSTTCALVPLNPNELTPARAGRLVFGHAVSVVGTRSEQAQSTSGLGVVKKVAEHAAAAAPLPP
jgi:hypothetical protein